jgi:2-iminobutanoate/2-iminopropanoate deaminase
MPRETISTDQAPKAIGPYAQAVVARGTAGVGRPGLVFCSGQIPLDPATGEMVGAGDVRAQAERVLLNLKAVLAAAGASLEAVVKTTIYLADLQDFAAVNDVYARFFPAQPPARATVQAAGLPRGALIEIDAIAAVD